MTGSILLTAAAMVLIPGGEYQPFLANGPPPAIPGAATPALAGPRRVSVPKFWLDPYPVTEAEFLAFVRAHPEWRRSRVPRIFADSHYLEHWSRDLRSRAKAESPVTRVSWFAAKAFCEARGASLPTVDQWEYAASERDPDPRRAAETNRRILEWYARPGTTSPASVRTAPADGRGVHGLHALVWEWTLDFNSLLLASEARATGAGDRGLFCGGSALGALDPTDYASFMRYSFRGSLQAPFSIGTLGFRCAREELTP